MRKKIPIGWTHDEKGHHSNFYKKIAQGYKELSSSSSLILSQQFEVSIMKPNFTSLLLRFIRCFILIFYKSFLMFVHVTIDKSLFSFIARSRNQYSRCHLDMSLKRHLKDLHVTATKSIIMRSYNQATINIIKMPIHHNQTKHIEINKYFIKNKIDQEIT